MFHRIVYEKKTFFHRLGDLRYDIIAGITVGLTLVPQCMVRHPLFVLVIRNSGFYYS